MVSFDFLKWRLEIVFKKRKKLGGGGWSNVYGIEKEVYVDMYVYRFGGVWRCESSNSECIHIVSSDELGEAVRSINSCGGCPLL